MIYRLTFQSKLSLPDPLTVFSHTEFTLPKPSQPASEDNLTLQTALVSTGSSTLNLMTKQLQVMYPSWSRAKLKAHASKRLKPAAHCSPPEPEQEDSKAYCDCLYTLL